MRQTFDSKQDLYPQSIANLIWEPFKQHFLSTPPVLSGGSHLPIALPKLEVFSCDPQECLSLIQIAEFG